MDQAIGEFETATTLAGSNAAFVNNLSYAYASSGRASEARKLLAELVDREGQYSSANANIALAYLGLGEKDQAMAWLDKAYQARFNPSILIRRPSTRCAPIAGSRTFCAASGSLRHHLTRVGAASNM